MRPALYTQVNNEHEAIFFIDKLFEKDPLLYEKCAYKLKEYKDYFASVNRIRTENIQSPGEYVRNQIFQKLSGHDVPVRRNAVKRIKDSFKRAWFENSGYPILPKNIGGITEFRKSCIKDFSGKTVFFPKSEKELLTKYAYFSLSSSTDVFWINTDGALDKESFKKYLATVSMNNSIAINSNLPLDDFYKLFFTIRTGIIIFENTPFLEIEKNREELFVCFNSLELPPTSQLIILESGSLPLLDENTTREKDKEAATPNILKKKPGKKIISITLTILILLLFTYPYISSNKNKSVLELKYFGDEIMQDPFKEGFLLTWVNKDGEVVLTEYNNYEEKHIINKIPEGVEKLLLSKGSYEIYPDSIPIEILESDLVRIMFYRAIRIPDVLTDSIVGMNAQRWYSFTLKDSTKIKFVCTALTENLSPQIALFTDRLGNDRLISCENIHGDKCEIEISDILPKGKYYIKVRGYDNMTGRFRLTADILPN